jgi:thiosulfate/3-mercaptopyruvate sulfurtransferase
MMVSVSANWLASNLDDSNLVIIDARGILPYRYGHIRNAVPLGVEGVISVSDNGSNLVVDAQAAEKTFSDLGIDDSKSVVVYGEYPDPSVARVVWTLLYYGHARVKLLDVGYSQWQKEGFPSTKQIPITAKKPTDGDDGVVDNVGVSFTAKANPTVRADAKGGKKKQKDPNVVIIDARTPQEHFQARIPGSILHNWEEGLGEHGEMIKDKDRLQKDFEEKGITKDKEIICYCHSGMRASHKYLQLKQAGFDNVRMYDGSIIDWANRRNPLR